ncbi:MAG: transporter, family, 4-hydroxybenzoate transporter [Gammaproteobacteria bacterium]|nr:transporter, family, 4-hydroxybenzoate transporter [Gammaproteobacteria bacterium]
MRAKVNSTKDAAGPMAQEKTPATVGSHTRAWVAAIGFAVAMIDGYDTLVLSFIAPLIAKDWSLPPSTIGAIFAASYAGAAIGATAIGIFSDKFGRKLLLLISLLIAGSLTVLCAWAQDPVQLMILRACAGIGLGGAIPTIAALTAQHAQNEARNAAVTRMFLGYPIGAIVGGAVTAWLMIRVGWRWVFLGGGSCSLFLLVPVALGIPEGRWSAIITRPGAKFHPLTNLISDGRGLMTVLFCGAVFLMLLTSYFLVSWTPALLTLQGMNPQRAAVAGVLLNVGGVVGALILSIIIGRKSPVLAVAVALSAGAILVALFGQVGAFIGNAAMVFVFAIGALLIGAQTIVPALAVHLYPASVYATGVGVPMAIGRIGSIAGPLIGGYLVSIQLGWNWLFLLAAVPPAAAALAMGILLARCTR